MSNSFDLNDPGTFSSPKRPGTRLLSNYSYQVKVTAASSGGRSSTQFITVRSNSLLTQEQILTQAEAYALGSGKSGVGGEITSVEITGAMKSEGV